MVLICTHTHSLVLLDYRITACKGNCNCLSMQRNHDWLVSQSFSSSVSHIIIRVRGRAYLDFFNFLSVEVSSLWVLVSYACFRVPWRYGEVSVISLCVMTLKRFCFYVTTFTFLRYKICVSSIQSFCFYVTMFAFHRSNASETWYFTFTFPTLIVTWNYT